MVPSGFKVSWRDVDPTAFERPAWRVRVLGRLRRFGATSMGRLQAAWARLVFAAVALLAWTRSLFGRAGRSVTGAGRWVSRSIRGAVGAVVATVGFAVSFAGERVCDLAGRLRERLAARPLARLTGQATTPQLWKVVINLHVAPEAQGPDGLGGAIWIGKPVRV